MNKFIMKKIFFCIISVLVFTACTDQFLETVNHNNQDVSSFYTSEAALKSAVNATYLPLAYEGMFGLKYSLLLNSLDPYVWFESPSYDIMNFNTTDPNISAQWNSLYYGLFRTSDVLANMNKVQSLVKPVDYNIYKAQLTALRGMYYFYLVTWYNAPIYYDETSLPNNPLIGLKNGTPEQFWNKLEEDLTYAANTLPDSWPDTETGRITKGAANAQLGKALLYKHYHYYLRFGKGNTPEAAANLAKAKAALKQVISGGKYKLVFPKSKTKADYQAAYLSNFSYLNIPAGNNIYQAENNSESIWEIQYDEEAGTNSYLPGFLCGGNELYLYFSPNTGSYRNQVIDPSLWNEFESVTGHPAGYTKDPRAFSTCYLDGDTMDWRPNGYNVPFSGNVNAKGSLYSSVYQGFTLSKAIGLKKYYYPQFLTSSSPLSSPNNFRVIRYADVLLMYAETCYQVDKDADGSGLSALNSVRARVDMPAVQALNPSAIVHERNVELATEGHHYNDIVRWSFDPNFGIDLNVLFNNHFDKIKNLYFPIPQSEINANKGVLKQNPGW